MPTRRPPPRFLILFVAAAALPACFDFDFDREDEASEPYDWSMESDLGVSTSPPQVEQEGPEFRARLEVEYAGEPARPQPPERWFTPLLAPSLQDNDLFKHADNVARVQLVRNASSALVRCRQATLEIDGERVDTVSEQPGEPCRFELDLRTRMLVEGVHQVRYDVEYALDTDPGTTRRHVLGTEEIRVLFNVVALAHGDGHLWVGTLEHGLLVYDLGADPMDPADDRTARIDGELVGSASILAILATPNGAWLGTDGGLVFIDHGGTPLDPSDDRAVRVPFADDPGFDLSELLSATARHIVTALEPDRAGGLWVGTLGGLFHVESPDAGDDALKVTRLDSDGRYDDEITRMALDPEGRLYLAGIDLFEASAQNSLAVLDTRDTPRDRSDDVWGRFDLPDDLPPEILALAAPTGDRVFIGTSNGLFTLDHGGTPLDPADDRFTRRGLDAGLPDDDVGMLLPTRTEHLWVGMYDACGTNGGGVARIDPTPCEGDACAAPEVLFRREDGLLDDDVLSAVELEDGRLVVGTFNAQSAAIFDQLLPGGGQDDSCVEPTPPARRLLPHPDFTVDPPLPPREDQTSGVDGLSVLDPVTGAVVNL